MLRRALRTQARVPLSRIGQKQRNPGALACATIRSRRSTLRQSGMAGMVWDTPGGASGDPAFGVPPKQARAPAVHESSEPGKHRQECLCHKGFINLTPNWDGLGYCGIPREGEPPSEDRTIWRSGDPGDTCTAEAAMADGLIVRRRGRLRSTIQ
jgi:hypothetical protein